jgi:hypothetical protein
MPILDVDRATTIVVIKRSMRHGSGIDNELHTNPKTRMYFADAKQALSANHVRDQDPPSAEKHDVQAVAKDRREQIRNKHDGIPDRQPVRQPDSRHLRRPHRRAADDAYYAGAENI